MLRALDALLERLSADAARLAGLPLRDLDGPRAAAARRVLRVVADQVQVASSGLLVAVEADGRWAAGGRDRTLPAWAARREGIAYGQARRELTLGRGLADLPAVTAAVVSGEITRGHAEALAEAAESSPVRREVLTSGAPDRDEAFLVEQARRLPVDQFRRVVKRWAIAVDDQAAEREHAESVARESFAFARRRDGVAFTGFLTHENGAVVAAALRAVAGVPAADDDRSTEQRQAAALTGAMRLVLDRGLAGSGAQVRPHLSVLVDYETLRRATGAAPTRDGLGARADGGSGETTSGRSGGGDGLGGSGSPLPTLAMPAELESGEPIPPSVLARLACDSEISRVVFGPEGQVLDVGRAQRTYSGQLRRAIIARDRHCSYPGCSAPPPLGEVHHIRWWEHGGETSIENGILLCWYHHGEVHRRRLRIRWERGRWRFAAADGTPLDAPGPRSGALAGDDVVSVPAPGDSGGRDRPPASPDAPPCAAPASSAAAGAGLARARRVLGGDSRPRDPVGGDPPERWSAPGLFEMPA